MTVDSRSTRVSFFGRFADELSRSDISKGSFQVSLQGSAKNPQFKEDGFFVFADLRPSPPAYVMTATSSIYQDKSFAASSLANAMVELSFPGEDELIVIVTNIDAGQRRVSFNNIAFLPSISEGATVIGPGGFSETLTETLEGTDVDFALLSSVAGLNDGDALRILRSRRMLLRPGPYYQFPAGTTLLALTVVENGPGAEPVAGAQIQITQVNAQPVTAVNVGGVNLNRAQLPGPPPVPLLLGPAAAVIARSNIRGHAIFYYPQNSPITALTISISKSGYVTTNVTAAVTAGQRTQQTIPLPRA